MIKPQWALVPFEVACARCGQDLHGLIDPVCPACEFEFDWSDAVPVEHLKCEHCGYALMGLTNCRCPECGTEFTWEGAIAAYHQSRHDLFEYRWRDRPVRSLFRTVLLVFRPNSLWAQLNIHDTPRIRPLLVMTAAAFVATSFAVVLVAAGGSWARWVAMIPAQGRGKYTFTSHFGAFLTNPLAHVMSLHLFLCVALTGATLLLLRQSMKRYRILSRQMFRVWAYTVPIPAAITLIFNNVMMEMYALNRALRSEVLFGGVSVVFAAYLTYLLRMGLHRYLRMPHAWGVAIAALLIGWLGSNAIMLPIRFLLFL